jgi:tetratricopeptide (TPR) repeat protein
VSDLFRKSAETFEKKSAFEDAFAALHRGLEFAAPDSLEAARIYLMGAGLFYRQGKHDQAAEWCRTCLGISHSLPETRARTAEARAQYLLAEIDRARGNLSQAIESAQRALSAYLLSGDVPGQSQALNTLANAYSDQGDFAQATRCYNDSLQLKQRIGDVAGQATILLNLGELYRARGDLADARPMYEQSLGIFRDLRYTLAVALIHNNLAAVAIAERQFDQAAQHLGESERLFAEIGSESYRVELTRHRAELELGQRHWQAALDHARQALALAEAGEEKLEIGLSRRVLGEAYAALDQFAESERELQAGLDMLESIGSTVEAATTRVALAHLRHLQHRRDDARCLIDAAVAAYDSIGAEALKQRALQEMEE